ncbi:MAG: rhomboid protease GluP [Planctomycetota bacterium]|jgi:rhomboid protease GluP
MENQREGMGELPLLIEVHRSTGQRAAAEAGLVLQARQIEHRLGRTQDGLWMIHVEEGDARFANAELAHYGAENRNWPPAMRMHEAKTGAWMGSAWYFMLLLAFFAFQTDGGGQWRLGVANAAAILDGDWWLAFSALLLHADVMHLVSNLVFGAGFGFLVAAELGSGPAWLGILLAGGMGNLTNAFLFKIGLDQEHHSLGASTSVFAAVGMLSVLSFAMGRKSADSFLRKIAPLVFGVVLLGMYGLGDERTDVSAHFLGFLWGCVFGGLGYLVKHRLNESIAKTCAFATGLLTLLVVVLTWAR